MERTHRIAPKIVERWDMQGKEHTSDINYMKIVDLRIEIGLDPVKEILIIIEETHIAVEAVHMREIEDLEAFRDTEIIGKGKEAIVPTRGDITVSAVVVVEDLIVIAATAEAELEVKQAWISQLSKKNEKRKKKS